MFIRLIGKMGRLFNVHSLRFKIFIICLIIVNVTVLSISYVVMDQAAHIITENAYSYIYESIRHADSNFDLLIQDASSMTLAIVTNQDVIDAMRIQSAPASYESFLTKKQVETNLDNMVSGKTHIRQATVISRDGVGYKSSGTLILKDVIHQDWFTKTTLESRVRVYYSMPDSKHITLSRPIRLNGQFNGVALVELDYETLGQVYAIAPLDDAKIITLSEDGKIVFSNYDISSDFYDENRVLRLLDMYEENQSRYSVDGEAVLLAKHYSPVSGLTSIGLISYTTLMKDARDVQTQSVMNMFLMLFVAIVMIWFFARGISKNISSLQNSMLQIGDGDLSVRSDIDTKDEIGIMSRIFNQMIDRIEVLMENVKDKERQKREAEQLALEAQIQPHFIYNTINSITYVAHLKGDKEIEDISRATVELLRGVLGVRESYIPLWQECEYIKQYTKIQRFKTNNDFVVRWEVEQELWTYMLPKLLLQPIVENAVLHGIYHQVDAVIEIQVTRMNDRVILRITDNGKGISPKQLDDIRHGTMEGAKMRSVGLSNVRSRIKAIYGSSYDMEISSVEGSFTSVVINLPASFEGDFDYVE